MIAPQTKLSQLKAAAAAGDWERAIAIAAKFPDLGEQRAAILDARSAYTNPRFVEQIGKKPEALIAAGRAALVARYGL